MKAYLGTTDVRKIIESIRTGNNQAKFVIDAMTYQISKGIGELAAVLKGQVDSIVLTGGMAYSKMITDSIVERVGFIAPVMIEAGENELEALAYGVLRVLRQEETAHEYHEGVSV